MHDYKEIAYTVDEKDQLISVSSEWETFARRNQAPGITRDAVLGKSLWEFVCDEPTREIYRNVLNLVRRGAPKSFILRCDGPKCRRLIEIDFKPFPNGHVEIKTKLLGVKSRPFQRLFSVNTPRNARSVMVCSWCNHVHVRGEVWMEVEQAMKRLDLEEKPSLPQMHHVICPKCYAKVMDLLAESETADSFLSMTS